MAQCRSFRHPDAVPPPGTAPWCRRRRTRPRRPWRRADAPVPRRAANDRTAAAANRHHPGRSRRSPAAPPALRPPIARTPTPYRPSGRPAPRPASARCRRSASARRYCRTPPARGRSRRYPCPARTARSPLPPRRRIPTTIRRECAAGRTGCAGCRTATACPPSRLRIDRGWSCPASPRPHPASVAPPAHWSRQHTQNRGRPPSSAARPRRYCPSPRTARPRTAARTDLRLAVSAPAPARRHPAHV